MTVRLHMQGITSLKQKRSIVKSLLGRLRSRFNVSAAEVDYHDVRNGALIGIAAVSNDSRFIDHQLDTIISFMRRDGRFYLGEVNREIF